MTGCFEIIEEIDLHKDGSGVIKYTLNASQSKMKLATVMKLDSLNGKKIPSEIDIERKLKEISLFLNEQEGISNCTYTSNHLDYIYNLKIVFSNFHLFNIALRNSPLLSKNNKKLENDFYELTPHEFRKNYFAINLSNEKAIIEKYKSDLQQANYTCIVRTENNIQSGIGSRTKISGNNKAAMSKYSVYETFQQSKNILFGINF